MGGAGAVQSEQQPTSEEVYEVYETPRAEAREAAGRGDGRGE